MYTIEDFLNNDKKLAIIADGSPQWNQIVEELRARDIKTYRSIDLDAEPHRSIVYGHARTDFIQSATTEAVQLVGYSNVPPNMFVLTPTQDLSTFLDDLL